MTAERLFGVGRLDHSGSSDRDRYLTRARRYGGGPSWRPGDSLKGMAPRRPTRDDLDERVAIPLDPETALRGLLAVEPDDVLEDDEDAPAK